MSNIPTCTATCLSNVVSGEKFKEVQLNTLGQIRKYLEKTYGPMGSYTGIVKGSNKDTIGIEYSKDGLKVLKNIVFDSPIEFALQSELRDICEYVEKKVGDGTTSAVILSSLIFEGLYEYMRDNPNLSPRVLVNKFHEVVADVKELILSQKRECTLDDIYNISMISTNGNEEVARNIKKLYETYGFDVSIDLSISNDNRSKIKEYDGLTINAGYSDSAYINNYDKGVAEIHNPKIYSFQDPVDTPEMIRFMEQILLDNIIAPASQGKEMTPTVIVCPMISRDGSGVLNKIIETMYQYDAQNMANHKPPVLIVTNISGVDEDISMDIAKLCNCRSVKKYINAELQKADQESGEAPTLETIHEFAGSAELVVADMEKTKFINPDSMKDGSTLVYDTLLQFIESELNNAIAINEDSVTIGRLKKRLRCLKANMVEYYIGGISISDRESLKDLVEDAIKNCASAAANGVGRAANFEGLYAVADLEYGKDSVKKSISEIIFDAYIESAIILYSSVVGDRDKAKNLMAKSISNECPYDVMDLLDLEDDIDIIPKGENVICSIMTDIEILDAISKIITMMVTSNQCLLQTTSLNRY